MRKQHLAQAHNDNVAEQPRFPVVTHPIGVTVEQAADLCGICRSKLFVAIANGELVARKAGRSTIVLYSDLVSFMEALPVWRAEG